MGLLKEFREFAVKGNVIDLAVGVIIGASFGKITSSLVEDVIMPPIGVILGSVDFTKLQVTLRPAMTDPATGKTLEAVNLRYGQFLSVVLQFVIIAFAVFLMVKAINKAKARFDEPPETDEPVVKECPFCLAEIPAKALKCKFCTSELASETPA